MPWWFILSVLKPSLKTTVIALPLVTVSVPTFAQTNFDCGPLNEGVFQIYGGIGRPIDEKPNDRPKRIKRNKVVLDETRGLWFETFKPAGGVGGVIPYKRSQMTLSKYLVNGQEQLCTSSRHEDVFGEEEKEQKFGLRCVKDSDLDGRFDTFRRYGELVSYNFDTGERGVATAPPQVDQPLVQPFRLEETASQIPKSTRTNKTLRSILHITGFTRERFTLRFSTSVSIRGSIEKARSIRERAPYSEQTIPLVDGATAIIGGVEARISRRSSKWNISVPQGLTDEAKLVCGGAALQTNSSIVVFTAGGLATIRR